MVKLATREDVKNALDSAETARDNAKVDAALDAATNSIEGLCKRTFAPLQTTVAFDWPDPVQRPRSWRLWLNQHELFSLTTFVAGGVTIPTANLRLYPASGPPYNRIEVDLGGNSAFQAASSYQQSLAVTGMYAGAPVVEAAAGALVGAVNASATTIQVTNSAAVGVGSLLRVDNERMIVTEKAMAAVAGQTLQSAITDRANIQAVPVGSGAAFAIGETILIDAERLLIVDIAANNLIVQRAWDGSALAQHAQGAAIYARRACTVQRAAQGSTAASHLDAAPILVWQPPGLIGRLAVAEALVTLQAESAGYAQEVRAEQAARRLGTTIGDLREQVLLAFGRQSRTRAV